MSLTYHAPSGQFIVPSADLAKAADLMLYAIYQIRVIEDLPLHKYKHEGPLLAADHAMKAICNAAFALGINLGGAWGNEIDVSGVSG